MPKSLRWPSPRASSAGEAAAKTHPYVRISILYQTNIGKKRGMPPRGYSSFALRKFSFQAFTSTAASVE